MEKLRNLLSRAFLKAAFTVDPPKPQTDAGDDYLIWLCFANAGMLDKGNLYLIDLAMKQLPSAAPILEIGSFCGLSANVLTHYKRKYGIKNRLITCDKWEFENTAKDNPHIGASPILFSDYKDFVRESFLRNIRLFSFDDLPFTVEATSDEFFVAWNKKMESSDVLGRSLTLGGPISFCYIDGDHSYEGVKKDFLNCDMFLENGGFLLFDDSAIETFGVRHLMPEVVATNRYRLVATNPHHLFQKVQP
jgi:hypothetical protein